MSGGPTLGRPLFFQTCKDAWSASTCRWLTPPGAGSIRSTPPSSTVRSRPSQDLEGAVWGEWPIGVALIGEATIDSAVLADLDPALILPIVEVRAVPHA